jgi:hypothetical protein
MIQITKRKVVHLIIPLLCVVVALAAVTTVLTINHSSEHAVKTAINNITGKSGSLNCLGMNSDLTTVAKRSSSKEVIGEQYYHQATCYAMKGDHASAVTTYKVAKTYLQNVDTANAKGIVGNINVNLGIGKPVVLMAPEKSNASFL